jgi:CTP synthase (UTP-ammonia lyase)
MKTILGICFGVALCFAATATEASAQRRGVNERQQNQQQRMIRGMRSGELTVRETARLAREQAQTRRMESRFRDSGDGLSSRERARLQHQMNQSSWHIYRQKHDRQDYPRP